MVWSPDWKILQKMCLLNLQEFTQNLMSAPESLLFLICNLTCSLNFENLLKMYMYQSLVLLKLIVTGSLYLKKYSKCKGTSLLFSLNLVTGSLYLKNWLKIWVYQPVHSHLTWLVSQSKRVITLNNALLLCYYNFIIKYFKINFSISTQNDFFYSVSTWSEGKLIWTALKKLQLI